MNNGWPLVMPVAPASTKRWLAKHQTRWRWQSQSGGREKLADWYCQSSGLRFTNYRVISALARGATPGPENSITKVVSAKKQQDIGSFGMDLMDMGGILMDAKRVPGDLAFQENFLGAPGYRIAGGTDEILRNIIAERVLGLPPDIRVGKNVPFNQIPSGA
jgi:alkylation response protein AidB-like acyl-CoA dehydrogenase